MHRVTHSLATSSCGRLKPCPLPTAHPFSFTRRAHDGHLGGKSWCEQDHHFPELLERGKTNLKHRREHAEREEQKHRLTVARKRQNIVEKVKLVLLLLLLLLLRGCFRLRCCDDPPLHPGLQPASSSSAHSNKL